jgi:hypothetical protein
MVCGEIISRLPHLALDARHEDLSQEAVGYHECHEVPTFELTSLMCLVLGVVGWLGVWVMMSLEGAQMPRNYPPESRRTVLCLLEDGRFVPQIVSGLQISAQSNDWWCGRNPTDARRLPGPWYRSGVAGASSVAFGLAPPEMFGRR